MSRFGFLSSLVPMFLLCLGVVAQSASPSTGELTVRLTQGLDSMTSPNGVSEGKVTKSTNPDVPVGSAVTVGVGPGPGGSFTARLVDITLNGKTVPASSAGVIAAPDFFNKTQEHLRAAGQPQDAVSGRRVYLPERMIIRFTLTEPSVKEVAARNTGPSVLTPTTPSFGPVGGPAFNPQTAPNLDIPAVTALAGRLKGGGGMTTVVQPGLEDGMSTFLARENVIADGVIQPAPPGFFRGMRGIRLNPGQPAQILDVRAMDDGEHDILHLMVTDNGLPTFGNIAFVFPKGQLATLSEPALEKLVAPFFTLPRGVAGRAAGPGPGAGPALVVGEQHFSYILEAIGLGMTLDQVRTAAKAAGAIRPPVKQGPVTYNVRTRDLAFQLELSPAGIVTQYNVSALNPRHLPETHKSGPLYSHLVEAFGPETGWGKQVIYDGEDGSYYAIVTDPSR